MKILLSLSFLFFLAYCSSDSSDDQNTAINDSTDTTCDINGDGVEDTTVFNSESVKLGTVEGLAYTQSTDADLASDVALITDMTALTTYSSVADYNADPKHLILAGNEIRGPITDTQEAILLAAFSNNMCVIIDNVQIDESQCLQAFLGVDAESGDALTAAQESLCSAEALSAADTTRIKDTNYQHMMLCKNFTSDDDDDIKYHWVAFPPDPTVASDNGASEVALTLAAMSGEDVAANTQTEKVRTLCNEYTQMLDRIEDSNLFDGVNTDDETSTALALLETTSDTIQACGTVGFPGCKTIVSGDSQNVNTSRTLYSQDADGLTGNQYLYASNTLASSITTNSYTWFVTSATDNSGNEYCNEAYCWLTFVSFDIKVNPNNKMSNSNGGRPYTAPGNASHTSGYGYYGEMGYNQQNNCGVGIWRASAWAGMYFSSWEITSAYFDNKNMTKVLVYPQAAVNQTVSYASSNDSSDTSTVSVSGTVGASSSGPSASVSAGYSETKGTSQSSSGSTAMNSLQSYGTQTTNSSGYTSISAGLTAPSWGLVSLSGGEDSDAQIIYPSGGDASKVPLNANIEEYTERVGFFVITQKSGSEATDSGSAYNDITVNFTYSTNYVYANIKNDIGCTKTAYASTTGQDSSGSTYKTDATATLKITTASAPKSLKYASENYTSTSGACPDGTDSCYWHMIDIHDTSTSGILGSNLTSINNAASIIVPACAEGDTSCIYGPENSTDEGTEGVSYITGVSDAGFAYTQGAAGNNVTYLNTTIPDGNTTDQGFTQNTGSQCNSDNTSTDLFHIDESTSEFLYNSTKTASIDNALECQYVCNADVECLMAKWTDSTTTCVFTSDNVIVYLDDTATCVTYDDDVTYYVRQGKTSSPSDDLCVQTNLNSCQS